MNHFVLRYAVRGFLVHGTRGGGGYISTAVAETGVAKPVELRMELRNRNGASVGTFYWRRMMSTAAETAVAEKDQKEENSVGKVAKSDSGAVVPSYWGIDRPKIKREDGSEWPWNCFMPWETYKSNTSIDLTKHHKPTTFLDKFAYWTVKTLRVPTDIFFQLMVSNHVTVKVFLD